MAMDVHLRNLRYFVAVAEDLHFSRAAERLHVSQPALSKQIRQLEATLGFPLLRRDRRRVELTAAGATLLETARGLLAEWDEGFEEGLRRASEDAALLRVGFQTSVAGDLYSETARCFARLRPGWRLVLKLHEWSDASGGLLEQSADAAFLWLPLSDPGRLEHEVLRREPRHVALPAGHALASRRAVAMADLLDEPFVALPIEAGPLRDHWLALDARGGLPARIGAEVATPDEAFEAVAAGHGVVLLAEGNAELYRRPGIVSRRVLDLQPAELAIAWRRADRRPAVRDLVRAALEAAHVVAAAAAPSGS
jgi:DNA-binding transcriptional LysR family regulator